MTWGVAQLPDVCAAREVERTPEGLARNRDEQVAPGAACHLRERALGLGNVLPHLDRAREIELVVDEGKPLGVHGAVLEVGRAPRRPSRLERLLLQVYA